MNKNLLTFKDSEERVKISHFTKNLGFDIKGIVHVGANDWYEYEFYKGMGIDHLLGFEPLPQAVDRFMERNPNSHNELFEYALTDKDGAFPLNVSEGDGQSSSMYEETPEYIKKFPTTVGLSKLLVGGITFKTFVWLHDFDLENFDTLVVDVEGMELRTLKGFDDLIKHFKYLSVELSGTPVYIGGANPFVVCTYLEMMGFVRVSSIEDHDDVFFIRKDLVND